MRTRLAAVALAAMLPACDSLDTFEVPVEGQVEIPGNPLGAVPVLDAALPLLPPFDFKDQKAFKDAGASADDIESVHLTSLRVAVVDPEGGTLDFLESIRVYAEVEGGERTLIAEKAAIPDGLRTLSLDVTDEDLKAFVVADEMGITTQVSGTPPKSDTILKARAIFEVNAAVF